ncbi:Gellan lyase precursor [Botrimarina colliarenosi]|uniref:Gellan lyase n=1 Tax=Botrimarina colliarenosi TaxID=2528001 RepID=A0A5C6A3M3_9BACT|nr:polysaccharide deacetylase family protein [Botrimarina colliarenosi]TWT94079.1 Gellan lyase precursor [Botrimarina colliarenosi]
MSPLRRSLLGLYQGATASLRMRAVRRLAKLGRAPVCVLFYHRVADTNPNDWTLSHQAFRRQIDWLSRRFDVVSLQEAQRRLGAGASRRPAVAITFDDGYGENCDYAIPLLLRRGLPFTYFVSTQIIRDQTAFPHDLAAGVRLRPNSLTELRAMAAAGVEIGAHTRTHPDLGRSTDADWLREEIVGSIEDITTWTGKRPRSFAFPFGQVENLTPEAMQIARDAGVRVVCSAYGAYNQPERVSKERGPFHLRRIHADPEWVRFTNWMTIDPRKLLAADPIDDDAYLSGLSSGPVAADDAPLLLPAEAVDG